MKFHEIFKEENGRFLKRCSSSEFDFRKGCEVLSEVVSGRLNVGNLVEFCKKDGGFYEKFWTLIELFTVVELPQGSAMGLIKRFYDETCESKRRKGSNNG